MYDPNVDKAIVTERDRVLAEEEDLPPSLLASETLYRVLRTWFENDASAAHEWRCNAREDFDFVAGEQWDDETRRYLESQGRPVITFNRVLSVIKAVAGIEINGRHETTFIPRDSSEGDIKINELLTQASQWMADGCDAEDEQSEAFQDALVCGMGWCLSDDAMVRLPRAHFATTRLYNGSVVEVDLENGHKLTGTPNHPVLTDSGWKRLCALDEGDNLISGEFLKGVEGFPIEQFDHVEARLKDKVDSLRTTGEASRLITAANDFYGDGLGSDVHIVYANRELSRKIRNAARRQKFHQLSLAWRDLVTQCRAFLLCNGMQLHAAAATKGQPAFSLAHAPCSDLLGNAQVAKVEAGVLQPLAHSFAVYAKVLGNLVRTEHLFGVETDHFRRIALGFRVALSFAKSMTSLVQSGAHSAGCEANQLSNLPRVEALAEIHFDKRFGADLRGNAPATIAFTELESGLSQFSGDTSSCYSKFLSDFVDWKPVLEVEARKFASRDNNGSAPIMVRVTGIRKRDVREFPVHDIGTSLGMFIAGGIVTSNTEQVISFEEDPEGKYVEQRVDPLEIYWDKDARSKNLIDARRIWRVRRMSIDDARSFAESLGLNVPDSELNAEWAAAAGYGDTERPRPVEERRFRDENITVPNDPKSEVYIVQAQWWERERYWRVADFSSGGVKDLSEKQFKTLQQRAAMLGVDVVAVPMTRRVYKQAFLGSSLLGPVRKVPAGDRFNFTCITGERNRNKGSFYGLVRIMRDPQLWANKWLSQTLHILNTTAKGGIIAEADAFADQRQAESSYAQPDAITWAAEGAIQKNKIMQKPGVGIPTAYVNLLQFAISSIRDVTGINMELLGMKDVNQPGILEAQRKQAALTILATLFDSLRRFRKMVGRIRLYYIQHYLSDGRLIRVVGDEGEGFKLVPLIRNNTVGDYDVIVDDAPTSPNQKEQTWGMLMQLMPFFKGMLTPEIAVMILEYSPLPSKFTENLKKLMSQPNPEAEKQKQLMFEKGEAEIIDLKARARKTLVDAELSQSKSQREKVGAVLDIADAAQQMSQAKLESAQAEYIENESRLRSDLESLPPLFENPFLIAPDTEQPYSNPPPTLPQLPFAGPPRLPPGGYAGPNYDAVPEPNPQSPVPGIASNF